VKTNTEISFIRSAYLGEDAGDLSALENPNTVAEISMLEK
jgi:hypothetical protein